MILYGTKLTYLLNGAESFLSS